MNNDLKEMVSGSSPIPSSRPLWGTRKIVVLIVSLVAVLVAGTVWWVDEHYLPCDNQEGLRESDGQCVGVTAADSAFDFGHTELDPVVGRIRAANMAAAESPRHVTMAVLLPIARNAGGIANPEWVRNQLQGAYQGQITFNHTSNPKVQLVIATAGEQLELWPEVVDQLDRMRQSDRLVAVTGFGLSLTNVELAMRALSDRRIPMVASTATADSLAGIPGLLRPAPTNKRQARAAAAYAKNSGYHTALLVKDVNKQDTYPNTLADAFVQGFEDADHRVLRPSMNYDSGLGNVDAAFALQLANLCAVPIDVVYFAGRGRDLATFVGQMANRLCQDRPVHILTGDDNVPVPLLRDQAYKRGLAANVDVVYTDLADAKAWAADRQRPQAERKFVDSAVARFLGDAQSPDTCFVCAFGESSLVDDDSILAYDAVYTATTAVQRAAGLAKDGDVDANMVLQVFMSLNGQNSIVGASGKLSYDNSGEASDKVVPLMKRLSDGTIQFMALQGG
ncbi:hypothetical protein GCM10029964_011170 [Kibdelosporangium lantanae]